MTPRSIDVLSCTGDDVGQVVQHSMKRWIGGQDRRKRETMAASGVYYPSHAGKVVVLEQCGAQRLELIVIVALKTAESSASFLK